MKDLLSIIGVGFGSCLFCVYFFTESFFSEALPAALSDGEDSVVDILNQIFPGVVLYGSLLWTSFGVLVRRGRRIRFLSSVSGGLRWGWLLKCSLIVFVLFALLETAAAFLGQVDFHVSFHRRLLIIILFVFLSEIVREYCLVGIVNRIGGAFSLDERTGFWVGSITSALFRVLMGPLEMLVAFIWLSGDPYLYLSYLWAQLSPQPLSYIAYQFVVGMCSAWLAWRTGGLESSIALGCVGGTVAVVCNLLFFRGYPYSPDSLWPLALMLVCIGATALMSRAAETENLVVRSSSSDALDTWRALIARSGRGSDRGQADS